VPNTDIQPLAQGKRIKILVPKPLHSANPQGCVPFRTVQNPKPKALIVKYMNRLAHGCGVGLSQRSEDIYTTLAQWHLQGLGLCRFLRYAAE
jgi:hypothetical protein